MAQYKALYERAIRDQADLRRELENLRREHEALTHKYAEVRRIQQEYDINEILYTKWKDDHRANIIRLLQEEVIPNLGIEECNHIHLDL